MQKKNYALKHKDKLKEYRKQYYIKNAEKIRLQGMEYRKNNAVIIKQRKKDYYSKPINNVKKNMNINLRYK